MLSVPVTNNVLTELTLPAISVPVLSANTFSVENTVCPPTGLPFIYSVPFCIVIAVNVFAWWSRNKADDV